MLYFSTILRFELEVLKNVLYTTWHVESGNSTYEAVSSLNAWSFCEKAFNIDVIFIFTSLLMRFISYDRSRIPQKVESAEFTAS